jgi:hypothetical protein
MPRGNLALGRKFGALLEEGDSTKYAFDDINFAQFVRHRALRSGIVKYILRDIDLCRYRILKARARIVWSLSVLYSSLHLISIEACFQSQLSTTPASSMLNSSLSESKETIAFSGIVKTGDVCPTSTFNSIGKSVP